MSEYKGFDLLDVLILVARRKKTLALLFAASLIVSYAGIFLFVEDQYDASATIIDAEDQSAGTISSLLKSFEPLPLKLGSNASSSQLDKLNTIIFSRSVLENVLAKFDLYSVYGYDSAIVVDRERAVKKLSKSVRTVETSESAYQIICAARDPNLAAKLTNYFVEMLNSKVISLRINKSMDNRMFLENRIKEIRVDLRSNEDSMKVFQERSGLLDVTSQLKEVLSVYADLEAELNSKQLQRNILENVFDRESPQVKNITMEIHEYEKKLSQMRSERQTGSVVLSLNSLPTTAIEYMRLLRNIEIGNSLLKFVMPLYEQSRFDEKKDYPILQVIDQAVPPGKRSYPPRVLLSLCVALLSVLATVAYWFLKQQLDLSTNPRVQYLKEHFSLAQKKSL